MLRFTRILGCSPREALSQISRSRERKKTRSPKIHAQSARIPLANCALARAQKDEIHAPVDLIHVEAEVVSTKPERNRAAMPVWTAVCLSFCDERTSCTARRGGDAAGGVWGGSRVSRFESAQLRSEAREACRYGSARAAQGANLTTKTGPTGDEARGWPYSVRYSPTLEISWLFCRLILSMRMAIRGTLLACIPTILEIYPPSHCICSKLRRMVRDLEWNGYTKKTLYQLHGGL